MEKKVTFKTIYLLLVITVGLLGLGLGSTYAMFTKEAEIDNPITFTSNLSYDSDVIETIDLILKPTEIKDFSLTVNNNTGVVTNYAIAYIDENYNIDIYGKAEDSTCKSIGTLENGKTCLFNGTVRNDGSEEIILTIAILSSDSSLILASNMETIPLRENLVNHITNLYTNATKTKVTNNEIEYNYATSESLMNDRLGGTTEDLNGGNIRYYGANPNNYIYFNCTDYNNQSASSCEVWRIIGIFDGKIKIVRNDSIGNMAWDETGSNNWARPATLNTYLNGEYYNGLKNDETRNKITSNIWNIGASSTTIAYSDQLYSYERGNTVLEGSPSTWIGNIALIYPSDYGYAANFQKCTNKIHADYREGNRDGPGYNQSSCTENNWLFLGANEWTLTPIVQFLGAMVIYENGAAGFMEGWSPSSSFVVRPTLYLNPDELIQGGTGSESNPYQLSNSYGKYFNGESDYVDMGYANLELGSFSVGARIYIADQRQQQIISSTETAGFAIGPRASGRIDFYVYSKSRSNYVWCSSISPININKYYTIIGTYDKKSLKIYIDGILDNTKDEINEDVIKPSLMPFTVGGEKDVGNLNSAYSYKGRISDVFLTSEVLDANTIANNFTNTFIYDEDDSTYFYYHLS